MKFRYLHITILFLLFLFGPAQMGMAQKNPATKPAAKPAAKPAPKPATRIGTKPAGTKSSTKSTTTKTTAQENPVTPTKSATTEIPKKTRILLLLDGSGSMLAKWETSRRIDIAKQLVSKLVDSLATHSDLELALRVYGHQFPSEQNNCQDSKLEVPFSPNNSEQIKKKLQGLIPKGNTPITYSLLQSANDFPTADKNSRNIIIIITDGLESCNADPCATSLALQKKKVFLRPFIIGIGADASFAKQFNCMGEYFDATDVKTFSQVLENVETMALAKTTVTVELKDEQGRPVETNVNMTFLNSVTGEPEYNYVHYQNEQGKTDVLDIDALLSYDLVINTIPQVIQKSLKIIPGKHNVFSVVSPQGTLNLRQDASTAYGQLFTIVRQNNSKNTLTYQAFGTKQKYLAGTYDLEIMTLPRTFINNVELKQGQVKDITIPTPGLLSIPNDYQGYGSIYEIDQDGSQKWVFTMPENSSKINLPLQPGNYRLVYRLKSANASKFTDSQDFTIRSGGTTSVRIFNK